MFGTPKNHRARTLVLPAFLAEQLSTHVGPMEPADLIFTTRAGFPLRSSNFRNRVWLQALADLEIDDLRIHDLRHTAASLAISAGASIKAVQRMLGHATAQITLDRYAGLYEEDLEHLAERLDGRFREAAVAQAWPSGVADVVELRSAEPSGPASQGFPLWARQGSNLRPTD